MEHSRETCLDHSSKDDAVNGRSSIATVAPMGDIASQSPTKIQASAVKHAASTVLQAAIARTPAGHDLKTSPWASVSPSRQLKSDEVRDAVGIMAPACIHTVCRYIQSTSGRGILEQLDIVRRPVHRFHRLQ